MHPGTIKVVMVDDHAPFTRLVEALLELTPDIRLLGSAHSESDFQDKVREHGPDAVLVDMNISEPGSGLKLLEWAGSEYPRMSRVVLTVDENWVLRGYENGAHGYLLKSRIGEVAETLRKTIRGDIVIPQGVSDLLVAQSLERKRLLRSRVGWEILSARENEILLFLDQGLGREEIAARLCISAYTVRRHIENILDKTGLASMRAVLGKYREAIARI